MGVSDEIEQGGSKPGRIRVKRSESRDRRRSDKKTRDDTSQSLSPTKLRKVMSPVINPVMRGLRKLSNKSEIAAMRASYRDKSKPGDSFIPMEEGDSSITDRGADPITEQLSPSSATSDGKAKYVAPSSMGSMATVGDSSMDAFELLEKKQGGQSDDDLQFNILQKVSAPSGRNLVADMEEREIKERAEKTARRRAESREKRKNRRSADPPPEYRSSASGGREKPVSARTEDKPASSSSLSSKPPSGRSLGPSSYSSTTKSAEEFSPTDSGSSRKVKSSRRAAHSASPARQRDDRTKDVDRRGVPLHPHRKTDGDSHSRQQTSPTPRTSPRSSSSRRRAKSLDDDELIHVMEAELPLTGPDERPRSSRSRPGDPPPSKEVSQRPERESRESPQTDRKRIERSSDAQPKPRRSRSKSKGRGTDPDRGISPKRGGSRRPEKQSESRSGRRSPSRRRDEADQGDNADDKPRSSRSKVLTDERSKRSGSKGPKEGEAPRRSSSKTRRADSPRRSGSKHAEDRSKRSRSKIAKDEDIRRSHSTAREEGSGRSRSRSKSQRDRSKSPRRSKTTSPAPKPAGQGQPPRRRRSRSRDESAPVSEEHDSLEDERHKMYRRGKRPTKKTSPTEVIRVGGSGEEDPARKPKPSSLRSVLEDESSQKPSSGRRLASDRKNLTKESLAQVRGIKEDFKQMRAQRRNASGDRPIRSQSDGYSPPEASQQSSRRMKSPAAGRPRRPAVGSEMPSMAPLHQSSTSMNMSKGNLSFSSSTPDLRKAGGAISLQDLDVGFLGKRGSLDPPTGSPEELHLEDLEKQLKKTKKLVKRTTRDVWTEREEIINYQRKNWSIRKSLMQSEGPPDSVTSLNLKIERLLRKQRELDLEADLLREKKDLVDAKCMKTTQNIDSTKALFDKLSQVIVPLLPPSDLVSAPASEITTGGGTVSPLGSPTSTLHNRKSLPEEDSMRSMGLRDGREDVPPGDEMSISLSQLRAGLRPF